MQNCKHIFIVGYPRSGTTYLQSLLATQAGVVSFPESHFYSILTDGLDLDLDIPLNKLPDIIGLVERYIGVETDETDFNKLKTHAENEGLSSADLMQWVMEKSIALQGIDIQNDTYTIVEKTPSHAFHMDRILKDFPSARFIQIKRHPVPAIDSYHHRLSKGTKPLSALIDEWSRSHDAVERFKKAHADILFSLKYEDLRADPAREVDRLASALDVPFSASELKRSSEVAEHFVRPFEEWKKENTKRRGEVTPRVGQLHWKEIATIQFMLRSRMEQQGYSVRKPILQKLYELKNGGAR